MQAHHNQNHNLNLTHGNLSISSHLIPPDSVSWPQLSHRTWLPTNLPTLLPICLPTYLPICLPSYHLTKYIPYIQDNGVTKPPDLTNPKAASFGQVKKYHSLISCVLVSGEWTKQAQLACELPEWVVVIWRAYGLIWFDMIWYHTIA